VVTDVREDDGPTAGGLELSEDLRDVVRYGWVQAAPVAVGPASDELLAEIERLRASLYERWSGHAPASITGLQPARRLYKEFGIDPTRTRPSSEALLRRVLRDLPLPRILNAVDVGNLLSLQFLLPIGLYDSGKIDGPVQLRRGLPGESFAGIRKDVVHLDGRPVLVDRLGPFGNPTSDSARTCVDPTTRSLWMVIFAPRGYAVEAMTEHVEVSRRTIERFLGAQTRGAAQ